jgi:hypothetical protein
MDASKTISAAAIAAKLAVAERNLCNAYRMIKHSSPARERTLTRAAGRVDLLRELALEIDAIGEDTAYRTYVRARAAVGDWPNAADMMTAWDHDCDPIGIAAQKLRLEGAR